MTYNATELLHVNNRALQEREGLFATPYVAARNVLSLAYVRHFAAEGHGMTRRSPLEDLAVLIVEDEAILAMDLEMIVADAGAAQVRTAASLGEAHVLLSSVWFDIAILDIRLMDGDSIQLAQSLIARGMSVVIHSGHIEMVHREEAPEAIFLRKPATPSEIVSSVLQARGTPASLKLPVSEVWPPEVRLNQPPT